MAECACQSCRTRAQWTPDQAAAFDRLDALDEAADAGVRWDLVGPIPEYRELARRQRAEDLRGRRFGHLLIIDYTFRVRRNDGHPERYWVALCECCGRHVVISKMSLRRGTSRCQKCTGSVVRRPNEKVIQGKTSREWARELGISMHALRKRLQRGLPLTKALQPPMDTHGRVRRAA